MEERDEEMSYALSNEGEEEVENVGSSPQAATLCRPQRAARMNNQQIDYIVDYMSTHLEFARDGDLGLSGHSKKKQMWKEVADLVSIHGTPRSVKQCLNAWNGLKKRAADKNSAFQRLYRKTGNPFIPPQLQLSDRDMRILEIWGTTSAASIIDGSARLTTKTVPSTTVLPKQPQKKKAHRPKPQNAIATSSSVLNTLAEVSVKSLNATQEFNCILKEYLPVIAQGVQSLQALPALVAVQQRTIKTLQESLLQRCCNERAHSSQCSSLDAHGAILENRNDFEFSQEDFNRAANLVDISDTQSVEDILRSNDDESDGDEAIKAYLESLGNE